MDLETLHKFRSEALSKFGPGYYRNAINVNTAKAHVGKIFDKMEKVIDACQQKDKFSTDSVWLAVGHSYPLKIECLNCGHYLDVTVSISQLISQRDNAPDTNYQCASCGKIMAYNFRVCDKCTTKPCR